MSEETVVERVVVLETTVEMQEAKLQKLDERLWDMTRETAVDDPVKSLVSKKECGCSCSHTGHHSFDGGKTTDCADCVKGLVFDPSVCGKNLGHPGVIKEEKKAELVCSCGDNLAHSASIGMKAWKKYSTKNSYDLTMGITKDADIFLYAWNAAMKEAKNEFLILKNQIDGHDKLIDWQIKRLQVKEND